MKVEIFLGNQSPPKHVIQCKNATILPKNVIFRAWQEKYLKNKKDPFLNIIFHPFAPPTLLGRFVPFLAHRVTLLT